jgi:hypothetical protein
MQSPTAGPASLRSGPSSARRRPAAAGRRHDWRSGAQPRQIVTPHLHLRCRRCTSAHTKPNGRSCLSRSGPGSARRSPAAAGRRHRILLISPPNSKHAGLRRRRGPDLPFLSLPLLPLLARAGDTAGMEQTGQNQGPQCTLERPTQSGRATRGTDLNRREEDQHRRHYTHGKDPRMTMQGNAQRWHLQPHKSAQEQD